MRGESRSAQRAAGFVGKVVAAAEEFVRRSQGTLLASQASAAAEVKTGGLGGGSTPATKFTKIFGVRPRAGREGSDRPALQQVFQLGADVVQLLELA